MARQVGVFWCFRWSCYLCHVGRWSSCTLPALFVVFWDVTLCSLVECSDISEVHCHQPRHCHGPEGSKLHSYHHENLNSHQLVRAVLGMIRLLSGSSVPSIWLTMHVPHKTVVFLPAFSQIWCSRMFLCFIMCFVCQDTNVWNIICVSYGTFLFPLMQKPVIPYTLCPMRGVCLSPIYLCFNWLKQVVWMYACWLNYSQYRNWVHILYALTILQFLTVSPHILIHWV
jgi:hypothetical protein